MVFTSGADPPAEEESRVIIEVRSIIRITVFRMATP
jgi:hypothetical protein